MMRGLTSQHHATLAANACLPAPSEAAAARSVPVPVTQARNARNSAIRDRRPRSRTQPYRQRSHRHRCLPAPVNPFLRIRSPHNGQRIAPADLLLLMEQANQQCQAPAECFCSIVF